jgi:hypothetical protein
LALRVTPAAVAFGGAAWWASGSTVMAAFLECRPLPLLAGMVLQTAAGGVLGMRWRAALESVGVRPVPAPRAAIVLSMRAQAAVMLAPGGLAADTLRAFEAGYGVAMAGPLAKVALLERLLGGAVLVAIAGASVLPFVWPQWGGAGGIAAAGLMAAALVMPGTLAMAGLAIRVRPLLGWTVLNQALALAGLALGMVATGIDAPCVALAALASVAALATMLPVSFNGYGSRELAMAFLAPQLGLDGKLVVASSLVASTALLLGLTAAGLAARAVAARAPGATSS